ncbi:hypothetical protein CPB86DRAFT_820672 [Serendipita vermifera]|nr:hypothetical protein CPB86DRAFT_820672 [Serendipita vermifera]
MATFRDIIKADEALYNNLITTIKKLVQECRNKEQAYRLYALQIKERDPNYRRWGGDADRIFEEEIKNTETQLEKYDVFKRAMNHLYRAQLCYAAYQDANWQRSDEIGPELLTSWEPEREGLDRAMAALKMVECRTDNAMWYMSYDEYREETCSPWIHITGRRTENLY